VCVCVSECMCMCVAFLVKMHSILFSFSSLVAVCAVSASFLGYRYRYRDEMTTVVRQEFLEQCPLQIVQSDAHADPILRVASACVQFESWSILVAAPT
jgi:hypothetical protein